MNRRRFTTALAASLAALPLFKKALPSSKNMVYGWDPAVGRDVRGRSVVKVGPEGYTTILAQWSEDDLVWHQCPLNPNGTVNVGPLSKGVGYYRVEWTEA